MIAVVAVLTTVNLRAQDVMLFRDPVPLPDIINSSAEEIQPVFDKDSSHLYFVRAFHPENTDEGKYGDQDIWVAEHNELGEWISVEPMKYFNNEENNGIFGLSRDGKTAYLLNAYLKRRKALHKGVSIANKKGDDWEHHPHTLKIEDFELHGDHYSFHISPKEDVMVISDSGQFTLGAEDLYVSRLGEDGLWHTPIHLGPVVNSAGYEISPFLSESEDTLYFASNRAGGFGDADIYYSVRLDDSWQNWTEPVNLGETINTEHFDAYFIMSHDDVYFCSNREGNNQIYHTHRYTPQPPILFDLVGTTDLTSKGSNDGTITIGNLEPEFTYDRFVMYTDGGGDSVVIENVQTNSSGELKVSNLGEGEYKDFKVYFGKYVGTSEDVAVLGAPEDPPPPPPVVQRMEEIIYFDRNSSYLDTDALITLKEFLPKLKEKSGYKIEVVAHTSKRASEKYNMWLSERRFKKVKEWLVSSGIDPSVITGSYEGESKPVHDCEECEDEKQHAENRRATLVVTF